MDPLLDHAPCGFVSFDDDGTITRINATLLEMLGHRSDALTGTSFEKILTVGTRIFYQTHFFPLVRMHGRADEIFLMLRCASGEELGVLANARRRTTDGAPENDCIMIAVRERQKFEAELLRARRTAEDAQRDAQTANAQLEQQAVELELSAEEMRVMNLDLEERTIELERLRKEADEANEAKSNFLAMMSHELRTPLNAISGYAQLLELGIQGPVSPSQIESLQRIQESQRHLLRLVNEILNLARIEAGHIEFNIQNAVLVEIVDTIIPLIEPQVAQKNIGLRVEVPSTLSVRCDVERTQQVLINLVSNAIKFTPSGGTIAITASSEGDDAVIAVSDTGIGIPANMIRAIFDPFVQVEVSRSRRGEGTGLGLAISRDLAVGMNGSLTATSVEGEGSTFVLRLPIG